MTQILFNGAVQGLLFAVLGLAFSLVYATTRVFHLALGAIFAAAPYVFLASRELGAPPVAAFFLSLLAAALLGFACEECVHWPLEHARATGEVHFIGSLGAFLVIGQAVVLFWGNDPQVLRAAVDTVHAFGGLRVTESQVLGGSLAVGTLAAVFFWLRLANAGLRFRALAADAPLLATLGWNVRRLRRAAFALSGVAAAAVAVAMARDLGFDPHVGMQAALLGVAATVIGGRGSFAGAAAAGLLLGLVRSLVEWRLGATWEDAATFLVLAGFLLLRPGGLADLAGRRARLETAP